MLLLAFIKIPLIMVTTPSAGPQVPAASWDYLRSHLSKPFPAVTAVLWGRYQGTERLKTYPRSHSWKWLCWL